MKFLSCLVCLAISLVWLHADVGKVAPDFQLENSHGKQTALSDYRGKYVILEWTNFECPFVRYHYGSQNMQNLQKEFTGKGVIWLSIISSAPGKQGYLTAVDAEAKKKAMGSHASELLLDPSGQVGRLYGAQTTPNMFIINPEGTLIYQGAIDDRPTPVGQPFQEAHNYVREALDQSFLGKPVPNANTKSYGCSVKY